MSKYVAPVGNKPLQGPPNLLNPNQNSMSGAGRQILGQRTSMLQLNGNGSSE